MVSVNQTASSYAALSSLKQIAKDLQTSQDRIATGLKITSAADNPTIFATAQNLRTDISNQDTYKAGLTTAKAKADVASATLDKVLDILGKMKESLGNAVDTGVTGAAATNAAVQKEIAAYKTQLLSTIKGASLDGTNLLTSTTGLSVKIGKDGASDITLDLTIGAKVLDTGTLTDPSTLGGTAGYTSVYNMTTLSGTTTTANIASATGAIDTAVTTLTTLRNSIAGYASSLDSQADFMQKMTDIRKAALSNLVDADLSEESAKVQALQVKQQLAYQALSIGNSSASNVLRLFQ